MNTSAQSLDKHHRFVSALRFMLMSLALAMFILLLAWPQLIKRMDLISSALKHPVETSNLKTSVDMTKVQFFSEDEKGQPFTISSSQITEVDPESKLVLLENLNGEMTLSSGVKLFASSPEALFDQNSQIVHFKQLLNVVSDNGYKAQTSDVVVDYKNRLAYTSNALTVRGDKMDLDSSGFSMRQSGEEVDLTGPARMVLRSEKRTVNIKADKLVEVRQKTQTVTAYKNVVADDGTNKIYCEELTAYFAPIGKNQYELRSVQAQKNVRIKTINEEITGNEAYYDMQKEKAFITGKVTVKREGGVVSGDVAVIDMKSGISQLEKSAQNKNGRVKGTIMPLQLKKKE